ncbi:hypothetical protein [Shewanella sp. 10N.286.48.A6]|uniref:hypothetical protein n=1 Tax=Shewanella sp. 10N.286.48.A6 TaxID=1880833 RepID=UPI000C818256|nr:hypothetical protein [Shewanella sp. 10N.286.48.A6]PMH94705.1 hypothetical protein BCU55_19755 [Shewanella sp. 10N.286.48.A6]
MDQIPNTFLSKASDVLGDTSNGLSGSNIVKAFTDYAFDYDIEIPHSSYPFDSPNKRSALLDNLRRFEPEQQYKIIRELCDHAKLPQPVSDDVNNLKIQLIARYASVFGTNTDTTLNQPLVEEVKSFITDFPDSEAVYLSALTKFNNGVFERNLVDDLRLSLELLLKSVFGNGKSLENQIPDIGKFISSNGGSKHFSNMFRTLVDYYTKYQNAFVKHNDAVIEEEVEFIFEMTSSFMKHLIKMHHKG